MLLEKNEIIHIPALFDLNDCAWFCRLKPTRHHDDEGHGGSGGHSTPIKNLYLPYVADTLWKHVKGMHLAKGRALGVDPQMKLYKLVAPEGAVAPHTDGDFVRGSLTARYSIVLYLNEDYEGGETIFNRTKIVAKHKPGEALLFAHDILHEARPVSHGTKFVLKTDIFV